MLFPMPHFGQKTLLKMSEKREKIVIFTKD